MRRTIALGILAVVLLLAACCSKCACDVGSALHKIGSGGKTRTSNTTVARQNGTRGEWPSCWTVVTPTEQYEVCRER